MIDNTAVWTFVFFCPHCGSHNSVGYGNRKTITGTKSKRKCKDCKRVFTNQPIRFNKKKNTEATIRLVLEISENHSLRETEEILRRKYGINITYMTVSNWNKEYYLAPDKKVKLNAPPTKKIVPRDDDWMYRLMLNTNTRTDYDGNKIDADWVYE